MGFWSSGLAFATVATESGLSAVIVEHIYWKVAVALLTALDVPRLETFLNFARSFGHFSDESMWAAAID